MIIYGWKSKAIGSEDLPQACAKCQAPSQRLHSYQRYAHIYYIPFFPVGKYGLLECRQCGRVANEKEMAAGEREAIRVPMSLKKTPLTSFSLCAVLAAVLLISAFSAKTPHDGREPASASIGNHSADAPMDGGAAHQ